MTDLDIIHKAIIESKGCKGDDFPYEYYCPDDFSVTINPEDWTTHHGEANAQKQIPIQLKVPEGYELKIGTCNTENYNAGEMCFAMFIDEVSTNCYIELITESNIININADGEIASSEVEPVTLNFKDLIFLGNKK